MGEAKRRRDAAKQVDAGLVSELERVASAVRRLCTAASGKFGADCILHARLAQALLARRAISSSVIAGFAAWRVGDGDGDVIVHAPVAGMPPPKSERELPFHAWVEVNGLICDATTYQLPRKATELDQLDGGSTTVSWAPLQLVAPTSFVSSLRSVSVGNAGAYYYERVAAVEKRIFADFHPLDEQDVGAAWLLYQHPDMHALGPNSLANGF